MANKYIPAYWYMSNNFGDNLNYFIIKALTGKEPVMIADKRSEHFIVCGSIITEANEKSTVWGAGFGNHGESISEDINVIACRGKLSAEALHKDVLMFDPGLLMPKLFFPDVATRHKIGIIPHWSDMRRALKILSKKYFIINPLKPVTEVITDILSCENIISSSLHGLILSDAYNVPSKFMDFGGNIGGDGFKFQDYYSTTDRTKESIKNINDGEFYISPYIYDLNKIILSCPMK